MSQYKFEPFDSSNETWKSYEERFTCHLEAHEVTDDAKKRAFLIASVGSQTYDVLKSLTAPDLPKTQPFDTLCQLLTKHLDPQPTVIMERYKFYCAKQKEEEKVGEFMARLRKLITPCKFAPTVVPEMLRDILVVGLKEANIQRKLLSTTDLDLDKALSLALMMETSALETTNMQSTRGTDSQDDHSGVDFIQNNGTRGRGFYGQSNRCTSIGQRGTWRNQTVPGSCYRCGRLDHRANQCPSMNLTCNNCGKEGHLGRVCLSSARGTGRGLRGTGGGQRGGSGAGRGQGSTARRTAPIHHLEDDENTAASPQDDSDAPMVQWFYKIDVHGITSKSRNPPWMGLFELNGRWVYLQLDTGAGETIMSKKEFDKLHLRGVKIEHANVKLKTYLDEEIPVIGKAKLNVCTEANGPRTECEIIIIDGDYPALVGRSWLNAMKIDWTKVVANRGQTSIPPEVNAVQEFEVEVPGKVKALLSEYQVVFDKGLGCIKDFKAHLQLQTTAKPKFFNARPFPLPLHDKAIKTLEKEIKEGILVPVDHSEWAAPMIAVPKPNGDVRLCADFKLTINPQLDIPSHPLPRIEDLLQKVGKGQTFTKLDLSRAYYQIELDEESSKICVINTPLGLLRYTRLPMGVASAPAIFQKVIDHLTSGLGQTAAFLDDLAITGKSESEHLGNLKAVLNRLQDKGVKLSMSKCEFMREEVRFLGHLLSKKGVRALSGKLEAIAKMPEPQNVDQVRSFIGMVTYHSKYVPNFATKCAPLYRLLQKGVKFEWDARCKEAFETIKNELSSNRLLTHYDPDLELVLACDASSYGVGAVLSHRWPDGSERMIECRSQRLNLSQQNYSQIEREAYAIVFGVKRFYRYLIGRKFTLLTDHKPLTSIFKPDRSLPVLSLGRIQRWAMTLMCFQYDIQYRSTKEHANADALSRLPYASEENTEDKECTEVRAVHARWMSKVPLTVTSQMLQKETNEDHEIQEVLKMMNEGWRETAYGKRFSQFYPKRLDLSQMNGLLVWQERLVVPTSLRKHVLAELHQNGHPGVTRMQKLAQQFVWWPGISSEIEKFVESCQSCQASRPSGKAQLGEWEKTSRPWSRIHIDHAGPFMGHRWLIVVDSYSHWLDVVPVPNLSEAATVGALQRVFAATGIPDTIVSDNGACFCGRGMKEFCHSRGIKQIFAPPHHPQSNGLAERYVRVFKESFKSRNLSTAQVVPAVHEFLMAHRATPEKDGKSPSEKMFGRRIHLKFDKWFIWDSQVQNLRNAPPELPPWAVKGCVVWVKWYGNNPSAWKWRKAQVSRNLGQHIVEVEDEAGLKYTRHLGQIRRCANPTLNSFGFDWWDIEEPSPSVGEVPVAARILPDQQRPKRVVQQPKRLNYKEPGLQSND